MDVISEAIKRLVRESYNVELDPELSRPDPKFGDFATNAALKLGKKLSQNPREIAEKLADSLKTSLPELVSDISVAGPGFLNIRVNDRYLIDSADKATDRSQKYKDQVIVTEYSDPNPFKVLHAGHLYTSLVGDAISNLLEHAGGQVHRVNFGGDVGMHVAKTMWAILSETGGSGRSEDKAWEFVQSLSEEPLHDRAKWMAEMYAKGNNVFEQDESLRPAIADLNRQVYEIVSNGNHESALAQIYWTCRKWSYEYFDSFYAGIGSRFEKYYPESQTAPIGIEVVNRELQAGVYTKSEGAVVFNGEPYGLHTRVFVNSNGLPTYEAKDVGLIMAKWNDYHFDMSVVITGNDIVEYMKVVLKSIEQFEPDLAKRSIHLTHGQVKLAGGVKMSSRKGNILLAEDILKAAKEAASKLSGGNENDGTALAAVKYALLKQRLGADIIYNPEESVSLEGNSGPYLQYAHARACSVLNKADYKEKELETADLEPSERNLVLKISQYPEAVSKSVNEFMPHHICTYLYELAQAFNSFYEHNRVIGNDRQELRLKLVSDYRNVLKDGLNLLGINAPERM